MNHQFVAALQDMLSSVAIEAATEAIRQYRIIEEQRKDERKDDRHADRLLLRLHEAAEQLAVSTATLERLTRSREVPCVHMGRSVRYSVETLRELIRQKEANAEAGMATKSTKEADRSSEHQSTASKKTMKGRGVPVD